LVKFQKGRPLNKNLSDSWKYSIFLTLKTFDMNEETETAVEFLFRMYMDNKQKLTLADFINAYDIETELLIQASEQNYQSEN
jgi:hypothetical protein